MHLAYGSDYTDAIFLEHRIWFFQSIELPFLSMAASGIGIMAVSARQCRNLAWNSGSANCGETSNVMVPRSPRLSLLAGALK
jgi:hypothetical protein